MQHSVSAMFASEAIVWIAASDTPLYKGSLTENMADEILQTCVEFNCTLMRAGLVYVMIAVNSADRAATNCSFGSSLTNSTSTSAAWSAPIAAIRVVSSSAIARFVIGLGAVRATETSDAADGAVDVRVLDATSVSITFSNNIVARLRSSIELLADNRNLSACLESAWLVLEALRLPFINADASNITGHLSVLYAHI